MFRLAYTNSTIPVPTALRSPERAENRFSGSIIVLHAAGLLAGQTSFEELSDHEQQILRRALRRPVYRLRCKLAAFNIQIGTISINDGCVIAFLLLFPEVELNGFRCDPQGGHDSQQVTASCQPDPYIVTSTMG